MFEFTGTTGALFESSLDMMRTESTVVTRIQTSAEDQTFVVPLIF